MGSEFYEQLGVERQASTARIRSAYGTAVARLAKRRRALVEQGGDPESLDLQRARLDEAWEVLSDSLRRRRYDAMLGWTENPGPRTADGVWSAVSDGLVHPAAAVAAKLLRVTSRLPEIGVLPLAPSGAAEEPPTLVPHDDDLTAPRAARLAPPIRLDASSSAPAASVPVVDLSEHWSIPPAEGPALRVVEGGASDVLVLPTTPPGGDDRSARSSRPPDLPQVEPLTVRRLAADEVSQLIDENGFSGALLRAVRERAGLSLQEIADQTRISIRYLEALESEARDALPSATFVRGYVREVARLLHLDADPVAAGYMRRFDG